ncbi:aminotransferase DegT [Planosporangium mesophilum]|uniref:Aminotransferase DegT n=2 Tax=Planosporangium mesophilum TaxID=689768 RepID=A0A8J3X6X3_9ACTN|nr:aminotransferase DegT [Planosporangium mesophilum]
MIPAARPMIGAEERAAVDRVMATGMLAQGPEVAAFETEFSAVVGDRSCVAVNSGTSALLLGLLAAGIGPGDEVIVPSFTFAATANAVVLAGAEPVFVDIEPAHLCIDPDAVLAAITPRTAAVMPVHLYGHPAAMDRLAAIADRHGLAVIEDAAQAHLATWAGRPVGTFGQVAAFSFYPTKNMTSGEGGMVVCADEDTARRVRLLRNQGMERRYHNEVVGYNVRMTDLHAAIGRVQLRRLAGWTATRQRNAGHLSAALAEVPGVGVPAVADRAEHVWHQYTIRVSDRDTVADGLAAAGVGSGVYYPTPVHELPSYGLSIDLPETRRACAEVLSLPVHPALSEGDLAHIGAAVAKVMGS